MPKASRPGMNQRTSPYPVSNLQRSRSPRPSTGAWSAEDDEILMNARAQQLSWSPLAQKYFPDKTGNACRKRHERLMEKKGEESWEGGKIEMLAREYLEVRQEMWQMLANRVGEKWQTVEAKCMEKGVKNLQLAIHSKGSSKRDSGVGMDEEEAADNKEALPSAQRVPLERGGMPSIAEILQRTSN